MTTGIHIDGKAYFEIKFEDQEIPESLNFLRKVTMQRGVGMPAPVIQIEVSDYHNLLMEKMAITDGTKVTVRFGKSPDASKDYDFIVYGITHATANDGAILRINCIPDCPEMYYEAARDYKEGSSMDAIKDFASKGGFEHDTDVSTQDNMVWMNCGEPRAQFIQRVTDYAYSGEQTCVKTVFTPTKKVLTRDLFAQIQKDAKATLCYSEPLVDSDIEGGITLINELRPKSVGGIYNSRSNYGQINYQWMADSEHDTHEKANPVVLSKGLPLNQSVKGKMVTADVNFGQWFDTGADPLNAYNVHKEYYKAQYLNERHLSLFTEGLRASYDNWSDFELLDTVKYLHQDTHGEPQPNNRYSGKYLITGITQVLVPKHYVEVVNLHRCFVNEAGTTEVIGGSGGGSNSSGSSAGSGSTAGSTPTGTGTGSVDSAKTNDLDLGGFDGNIPTNPTGAGETLIPDVSSELDVATELAEKGSEAQNETLTKKMDEFREQASSTGNKSMAKATGFMDDIDALASQPNSSLKEAEASPISKAISAIEKIQADTVNEIKKSNEIFSNSELVDKYGKESDKLDAMMREFSTAKEALAMCEMISPAEGIAIDMVKADLSGVIGALGATEDLLNSGIAGMNKQIQKLIDAGELPADFAETPRHKVECSQLASSALNKSSDIMFPNQCRDKVTWDKLSLPKINLASRLDKVEEFLRDVFCSMGKELDAQASEAGITADVDSALSDIPTADEALRKYTDKYNPTS